MKIVGFVAPKQAGKDTAADILKELGLSKGKISFAGPLKKVCSEVFGIAPVHFNDPIKKETPFKAPIKLDRRTLRNVKKTLPKYLSEVNEETNTMLYNIDGAALTGIENRVIKTPRQLLQVIGTDLIRDRVFEAWHLNAAFSDENLNKLVKSGVYCVTDIRFPDELEFLQNKFGSDFQGYYIENPEAEQALEGATHPSELNAIKLRELLGPDAVIKNDGSLKDYEKLLKKKFKDLAKSASKKEESGQAKKGSRFVYGRRK